MNVIKAFFNVYYYDDNEDESEIKIEKYIPDALQNKEFIKISEFFDQNWRPDCTLIEVIKYHYRKFKYHLKGIKIYFFGRSKIKINCGGKNNE